MGDAAFWTGYLPLAVSAGAVACWAAAWWGTLYPRLLLYGVSASLIAGQLVRLPLPGQGGGLLISDVAALALLLVLGLRVASQAIRPQLVAFTCLLLAFLLYALYISWLNLGSSLTAGDFLITLAYWARLAVYLMLLPLLLQAASADSALHASLKKSFFTAAVCLALLGLAQYFVVPNLASLNLSGWDPHVSRLVSTWLDPNLVGLLFVIAAPAAAAAYVHTKQYRYLASLAAILIALLLTASRSSFIAAAVSFLLALVIAPHIQRRLSVPARLAFISAQATVVLGLLLAITLFPARFAGLAVADDTVSLRAQGLSGSLNRIVEPNALLGVGYNAYQFAAARAGLISDFSIHSRAGADNSVLTLWATTGAVGLILAGGAATCLVAIMLSRCRQQPALTWVFFTAVAATFIHSQFVNSALYGHIILSLVLLFACLYSSPAAYDS